MALQNYRSSGDMLDIIDSLLNHGANPNTIYYSKNSVPRIDEKENVTILMYACLKGDLQLIDTILKHKPDINLKDKHGKNALFYAINADKGDNADIIFALVNAGIDVNATGKFDHGIVGTSTHSPLTLATIKNMKNTVRILLEHGANANYQTLPDEDSSLHLAVKNANVDLVNILISKGANLLSLNKDNKTPHSLALSISQTDIYRILVEEYNKNQKLEKESLNELIKDNTKESVSEKKSNKKKVNNKANPNVINKEFINDNVHQEEIDETIGITGPSNLNKKQENTHLDNTQQNSSQEILHHVLQTKKKHNNLMGKYFNQKYYKPNYTCHSNSLEIPIEFRDKLGSANNLSSFIKMGSPPVLRLDFSDQNKANLAILQCQVEELTIQLIDKEKYLQMNEETIKQLTEENKNFQIKIDSLLEQIDGRDKTIFGLQNEFRSKEEKLLAKISHLENLLVDKTKQHDELCNKYIQVEKDLFEIASRTGMTNKSMSPILKKEFLDRKFLPIRYDDKYIIKCLQKDILDFQEFTKEQIKRNKADLDELLRFVQAAINECISEYEVRLYGSHATNLCLGWSDLDIVLVNKKTHASTNYGVLQTLYLHLLDKPWKKTIKFIDTALIPIIKITSTDEYNSMQMDISLQDNKHYGLKCVDLVKSFMNEYEALEPLIFALKNLLRNANLNDPYTGGLSSYGLILMVVSYLQSQLESKKSIKIADGNIGRLFLEFLCYYGLIFDHTKYVIYTYPPNDINYVDKDNNNFFFNMQSGHELIIVDPLNKSNNVARSTFQFVNIKMAFMIGFVVSREECECGCHYTKTGDDACITNTEHCILKRIFNSVKRFNSGVNNS